MFFFFKINGVQLVLANHLWAWGPVPGYGYPVSLQENWLFPSTGGYHLEKASWLWVGPHAHFPSSIWLAFVQVLCGVTVSECICASALLCVETTVSLTSSISHSYGLSVLSSTQILSFEGRGLIEASHSGPSIPKLLILFALTSCGFLCLSSPTAKRIFCDECWAMHWSVGKTSH